VTCFRNITKLRLYSCRNITDFSPLSGVYELDLNGNDGLTDVSALVHCLKLSGCGNISDVSSEKGPYFRY
jgi:hypothetical protein